MLTLSQGRAVMKKVLYVIAFLFVVGVIAGPKDSSKGAGSASAQSYGSGSLASSTMDDIHDQVIRDAEREYQMASSSGTNIDRCVHAGIVAAAYLQAHRQPSYQSWKMREEMDCGR
jgi:hypothetical protein